MKDLRLTVVDAVKNLRAKNNSGNFLTNLAIVFQSNSVPWGWPYISDGDF
jgi:hypothetical protein